MDHWDVFIAHAGRDKDAAVALYDALDDVRVFLDAKDLKPGDLWDEVLPQALEASRVIVILISDSVDKAWYLKEEISLAIDEARAKARRIIPVYLGDMGTTRPPYGLKRVQSLSRPELGSWGAVANEIRSVLGAEPRALPAVPEATLDHEELERLVDIVLQYRADRDLMLAWLPPRLKASLKSRESPLLQWKSDINILWQTPVADGVEGHPFAVWLRNLESHVRIFPEVGFVRTLMERFS